MGKYPIEGNKRKFLGFNTVESAAVDVILQGRVAAWLRDTGLTATGCYGRRPRATQERLYKAWIAYLNYKNYPTKYPRAPKANPAAPPGGSWHEYGQAIDLQGAGIEELVKRTILPYSKTNQPCNAYGIAFTMNMVDAPGKQEWWHVVSIEAALYKGDRSKFTIPAESITLPTLNTKLPTQKDELIWVKEFTRLTKVVYTEANVKRWQVANKLVADGIIGPRSWEKAYTNFKG